MKQLFVLLALLGLLASCRSSRTLGRAVGRKDTTARASVAPSNTQKIDSQKLIAATLAQVAQNRITFTTFNGKAEVDYKGTDGKKQNANAIVRIQKDSIIWVSVTATILGIEALRVLVTKDSVKLLNKLEKTVALRGINFLQEATKLPLDFYTLQDLIVGNPVYLDTNNVRYSRSGNVATLVSVGDYFKNLLSFSDADGTLVHSKLTDNDPFRARTADLSYSNYESTTGRRFATKRQVLVSERGRLEIRLDYKNYSFNGEVSFPFKVPKNFTRL